MKALYADLPQLLTEVGTLHAAQACRTLPQHKGPAGMHVCALASRRMLGLGLPGLGPRLGLSWCGMPSAYCTLRAHVQRPCMSLYVSEQVPWHTSEGRVRRGRCRCCCSCGGGGDGFVTVVMVL